MAWLEEIAAEQMGHFTLEQAQMCGFTEADLETLCRPHTVVIVPDAKENR